MDNRLFRKAMAKFATGITVVTTEYKEHVYGMTVNAFMSVSLEPKLVAVSIDEKASMYNILQQTDSFGVSILSEKQADLSDFFAKQSKDENEISFDWMDRTPVLKNSLAKITCKTHNKVKAGDHLLFIAEVTNIDLGEGKPILYYGSQYHKLAD